MGEFGLGLAAQRLIGVPDAAHVSGLCLCGLLKGLERGDDPRRQLDVGDVLPTANPLESLGRNTQGVSQLGVGDWRLLQPLFEVLHGQHDA